MSCTDEMFYGEIMSEGQGEEKNKNDFMDARTGSRKGK